MSRNRMTTIALAAAALLGSATLMTMPAHAQTQAQAAIPAPAQTGSKAPDVLIKEVSIDVLDSLRADKSIKQGDVSKVIALVDQKVMPYVDFQRMTSAAVGRYWRQATP